MIRQSVTLLSLPVLLGTMLTGAAAQGAETVSRDFSFTKTSSDFTVKNAFPVMTLPPGMRVLSLSGTVFTITRPGEKKGRPVASETLFGINATGNGRCPAPQEPMNGYGEVFGKYNAVPVSAVILKQVSYGTKAFDFSYNFPRPVPLNKPAGSCLFAVFDGTDFANGQYTMGMHLKVTYDTAPATRSASSPVPQLGSLDGEFLVGTDTVLHPTLNAYTVIPVHPGGPVPPGTQVLGITGNVSASSELKPGVTTVRGKWSVTHLIMRYPQGMCQTAFPHHNPDHFTWNDPTGTARVPNPTSAFRAPAIRLGGVSLHGNGVSSVAGQVAPLSGKFPFTLQNGDCLVDAIIPAGVQTTDAPVNTEAQINFEYLLPADHP